MIPTKTQLRIMVLRGNKARRPRLVQTKEANGVEHRSATSLHPGYLGSPVPAPSRSELIERLTTYFQGAPQPFAAAWLFGSQARGTARADSDVDVAVLYGTAPDWSGAGGVFDVEGDLEKLVRRPVQVIPLDTAPVDLVHRVLRDGVLLVERDRQRRITFEVRSRNEYFDLLPHLLRYRRQA